MSALWSRFVGFVSALALALEPLSASANPLNPVVVGGAASIAGQGTPKVVVDQTTNRAIIDWRSFNIAPNETTQFIQPNASSVTLNRVTGALGPSQINGIINGNGGVYVVNPDGILIGRNANINVGSFLATTHDISNKDFMAGKGNFTIPGNPSASVVNQGMITAATGGFAALVAPGVRNDGVITARLGSVALASGNAFTLDLYGDNLITLQPGDAISAKVVDVATGQTLQSLVQNTGKLKANGGTVSLTAVSAKRVIDSVINSTGVIEADSVGARNGLVVFGAATAATKPAGAPTQTVKVAGKIRAAGRKAGTTGGKIQIAGENIRLSGAKLDASGRAGGGTVLIGGVGHSGAGTALPVASEVTADAATTIDASATASGPGGSVVLWSGGLTTSAGVIAARGGPQGGDGGLVETSGKTVDFTGLRIDTSAPAGKAGTWLVDPTDLTVDGAAATTIATNLATTNVTLQTNADGTTSGPGNTSAGPGDIIVSAPITWTSANSLTLSAYHSVAVNAGITSSGGGNVSLRADNSGIGAGTVTFSNSAVVSTSGAVSIFYNPPGNDNTTVNYTSYTTPNDYSRDVTGGAQLTAYMLVNTVYDLQNVQNNLSGDYALGTNIDASATSGWNGGAGFAPIGNASTNFTGVFNGLGNTVSGLVINLPTTGGVGLFGWSDGSIADIGLIGGSVTGYNTVGQLAGNNSGAITQSYATGAVTATVAGSNTGAAGGLVGSNGGGGIISQSYATGPVSGLSAVGGLVGINYGAISQSYATGAISGGALDGFGGLVGVNFGSITQSFATGAVSAATGSDEVGGLVGQNGVNSTVGTISQSYATGSVSGSTYVGGLVGINSDGSVSQTYATGAVTGTSYTGGLVGTNTTNGNVTASYWDTTTGLTSGVGSNSGTFNATGLTTSQFATASNFSGWNFGANPGGQYCATGGSCWVIVDGNGSLNNGGGAGATRPMLLSEYSTTIANPHQLQLVELAPNAKYALSGDIALGAALANLSDVWGPNGSAGFVPIGLFGSPFNGAFDGQGHTISGLTINLPSLGFVGLFSAVGSSGVVENVGLLGGSVSGGSAGTGALVASNNGTLTNVYATTAVSGAGYNTGGLVGQSNGAISQSYATGAVLGGATNNYNTVGGLVGTNSGSITQSYATGEVTARSNGDAGGLVGNNSNCCDSNNNAIAGASITTSYATGAVSSAFPSSNLGGLVGFNNALSPITNSHATGDVSSTATAPLPNQHDFVTVGGLVGQNQAAVSEAYATGAVTAAGSASVSSTSSLNTAVGGLIGQNGYCCDSSGNPIAGASITGSYATGAVSSGSLRSSIGGLVGFNNVLSPITNSNASGNVSSTWLPPSVYNCSNDCANIVVGGLVGNNGGAVSGSYATGTVTAAGSNGTGTANNSYTAVGGLAGQNGAYASGSLISGASILNSYAEGAVAVTGGNVQVGGLVGQNNAQETITGSHATGNVSATGITVGGTVCSNNCPYLNVGELVGFNQGSLSGDSATGAVTAGSYANIGGLVGSSGACCDSNGNPIAGASIMSSYATGAVSSAGIDVVIGGLVGNNGPLSPITNSYATGNVSSTGTLLNSGNCSNYCSSIYVGGLVGSNSSVISGSYATGTVTAVGSNPVNGNSYYSDVGGLVGGNGNCCDSNGNWIAGASIVNSYANGAVTSAGLDAAIGGLVGFNGSLSPITNSHAIGNVSATGIAPSNNNCSPNCPYINIGGLAGVNGGAISGSYASGVVTAAGSNTATNNSYVAAGGLVGQNGLYNNGVPIAGTTISTSYATGAVNVAGVNVQVGGLVGQNFSLAVITSSNATRNVSATGTTLTAATCSSNCPFINVGGLVGQNDGIVTGSDANGASYATGAVIVGTTGITGDFAAAGGLVGSNDGAVSGSYATGAVTGGWYSHNGGLVGGNGGTITSSYAMTGTLTASGDQSSTGGLVGYNFGAISQSYAKGAVVSGAYAYISIGGLVGYNDVAGTVASSNASGSVTEGSDHTDAGGLVGTNYGGVSQSYATGVVNGTGSNVSIGGLVGNNEAGASVAGSYAQGSVTAGGDHVPVGGLVGYNDGAISLSYAQGAVSSMGIYVSVGGLVGYSDTAGTISSSQAQGSVTEGGDYTAAGGLVGYNYGAISQSYAHGDVGSAGVNVSVGGLVGYSDTTGAITNSQAYGDVASTANLSTNATCTTNCPHIDVGGFVGRNLGTISGPTWTTPPALPVACGSSYTCADGNVSVGQLGTGGGFVGVNGGIISYAFATGNVTGAAGLVGNANTATGLGGFVFLNQGQISNAFATGSVGAASVDYLKAGGFAVRNGGTIDGSFAVGDVQVGDYGFAGGFLNNNSGSACASACGVGYNTNAAITNSQAYGNVTAGASSFAGGFAAIAGDFAGYCCTAGSFTNITAQGAVSAGADSVVGGLVGALGAGGSISNSSAQNMLVASTGANSIVGGIAGVSDGSITGSTSTAPVSGTSNSVIGGLVGANLGLLSSSSVNATVTGSGGGNFIGGVAGLNAGTITGGGAQVTLASSDASNQVGGVAGVNGTYVNETATFANSSFPSGAITSLTATGSGFSAQVGTTLPGSAPSAPSVLSNPACADPACAILAGGILAAQQIIGYVYINGTPVGSGVIVSGLVNGASFGTVTTAANGSYDFWLAANTIPASNAQVLTYVTGANAGVAYQQNAPGSISNLNIFSGYLSEITGESTLSAVSAGLTTAIGGNTTVKAIVSGLPNLAISASAASFNIDQPIATTGALTLDADGAIGATAAVNVGAFTLAAGNWTQLGSSLPSFSAQNFSISGGSFLRALGGNGSTGLPYQIADLYGLQGIGSSPALLADNYALANNIDATGTANWNGGAGFAPIGTVATPFTGVFDGQGHTIANLAINRPSSSYVGLFGVVGAAGAGNGLVEDVGLVGGSA